MSELYIAIGSSDGINVDLHFGSASGFFIYSFDESGEFKLLGKREIGSVSETNSDCSSSSCSNHGCSSSGCSPQKDNESHDDKLLRIVREVADCDFVIIKQIGSSAKRLLTRNHITPFELSGDIEKHLEKLKKYLLKSNGVKRLNSRFGE